MAPRRPRFYIAAPSELQREAWDLGFMLDREGLECTAGWLNEDFSKTITAAHRREAAQRDITDIQRADVFVLLNPCRVHRSGTGGRHVETGVAIALGKPILLLGQTENIFHDLSPFTVLSELASCSDIAREIRACTPELNT